MKKKDTIEYLMGDDYLFILLKIIDYPKYERELFDFSDFSGLKYKNLNKSDLLLILLCLRDLYGMDILNLSLDENKNIHFWKLIEENSFISVRKILKKYNDSEINLFLKNVNFRMIVSFEIKKYIRESIKEYIKKFMSDKWKPLDKNYPDFIEQKDFLTDKIKNDLEKYKKTKLVYDDSKIDSGCKFIETMLSLEKVGLIKIEEIINISNLNKNGFYRIFFTADEKLLKYTNSKTTSIDLPADARWESIKITFIKENEVNIYYKNKDKGIFTCQQLNMWNKRDKKPDYQWELLTILSQNNGQLDWDNPAANKRIKMTKCNLSKKIRNFFRIIDDPFLPYKEQKCYKLKFITESLVAPKEKINSQDLTREEEFLDGEDEITEYFNKQKEFKISGKEKRYKNKF